MKDIEEEFARIVEERWKHSSKETKKGEQMAEKTKRIGMTTYTSKGTPSFVGTALLKDVQLGVLTVKKSQDG